MFGHAAPHCREVTKLCVGCSSSTRVKAASFLTSPGQCGPQWLCTICHLISCQTQPLLSSFPTSPCPPCTTQEPWGSKPGSGPPSPTSQFLFPEPCGSRWAGPGGPHPPWMEKPQWPHLGAPSSQVPRGFNKLDGFPLVFSSLFLLEHGVERQAQGLRGNEGFCRLQPVGSWLVLMPVPASQESGKLRTKSEGPLCPVPQISWVSPASGYPKLRIPC